MAKIKRLLYATTGGPWLTQSQAEEYLEKHSVRLIGALVERIDQLEAQSNGRDHAERDRMAERLGLNIEGDDMILMNGKNGPEVIKRG